MKIIRANLQNCGMEKDTVVVIDVLRAFTTAAMAFSRGAKEIILAGTVEELFHLAEKFPKAITIGEINGIPIEGVDFGNSPSALEATDLTNRILIQRTTTGTQGILRSINAQTIFAAAFCCAGATARSIMNRSPKTLTFIESGDVGDGWGDEDKACADYIEALIKKEKVNLVYLIERVIASKSGSHFINEQEKIFPRKDLSIAVDIDRFDFSMKVFQKGDYYCLHSL